MQRSISERIVNGRKVITIEILTCIPHTVLIIVSPDGLLDQDAREIYGIRAKNKTTGQNLASMQSKVIIDRF